MELHHGLDSRRIGVDDLAEEEDPRVAHKDLDLDAAVDHLVVERARRSGARQIDLDGLRVHAVLGGEFQSCRSELSLTVAHHEQRVPSASQLTRDLQPDPGARSGDECVTFRHGLPKRTLGL